MRPRPVHCLMPASSPPCHGLRGRAYVAGATVRKFSTFILLYHISVAGCCGWPGGALDWPHRVRIAIGAARGLSYLHNDCSPRVIHRDIKSSNILLDAAFEAKVGGINTPSHHSPLSNKCSLEPCRVSHP